MFKFGLRNNLIYPTILSFSGFLRQIVTILMDDKINFNSSILLSLIMFFSEIIFGFILYKRHKNLFILSTKNNNDNEKKEGVELIHNEENSLVPFDTAIRIYIYIFLSSLFDFIDFISKTYYLNKINVELSQSLYIRLRGFIIIFSSLFSHFLLKFNIYKHQKLSLIIIFFCLIIILFSDYYFSIGKDQDSKEYIKGLLITILGQLFFSFQDNIEKYLLEYDYINNFQLTMLEGCFGLILTLIFFLFESPSEDINHSYDEYTDNHNLFIILIIIFLLFYFFLSGFKNIYRILTNKYFSPTTKSLADVIMDPILIIIYYAFESDFKTKGQKKGSYYFIINIFISFILVFVSCIYNEFIVLYCFKLEHDTFLEISLRAQILEIREDTFTTSTSNEDSEDQ